MTTNDDADHAVLDMALAEALGRAAPPDLWPALAGNRTRGNAARNWLAAALVLLGTGVVVATALLQREPELDATVQPEPVRNVDADGPASLAELQARFAAAQGGTAQANATWSSELGTFVPLVRFGGVELMFQRAQADFDVDEIAAIHAALLGATEGDVVDGVVWTHMLWISKSSRGRKPGEVATLLVQLRPDAAPRFAFVSPRGAVALAIPAFPAEELQTLARAERATIESLGVVIGSDGFASIPQQTWRLRLVGVPARAHGELERFSKLRQLDLTESPAWHETAVLRSVARSPVQELMLQPALLAADAWPTIGSCTALRELHLSAADWIAIATGKKAAPLAPGLDDAAIVALRELRQLTELTLSGGSFGDGALRVLGSLPELHRLWLIGCSRIGGDALRSFATVSDLGLLDCDGLGDDLASSLAAMPKLVNLGIRRHGARVDVAALRAVKGLRDLYVAGRVAPEELRLLADCGSLQKLALELEPPLRDADLVWLHALQQLKSLRIASDAVTANGVAALKAALPRCTIGTELW